MTKQVIPACSRHWATAGRSGIACQACWRLLHCMAGDNVQLANQRQHRLVVCKLDPSLACGEACWSQHPHILT